MTIAPLCVTINRTKLHPRVNNRTHLSGNIFIVIIIDNKVLIELSDSVH